MQALLSFPKPRAWIGLLGWFRRNEDGGGTAFSLFGVLICLVLAGSAIDITNAWRNRELLNATADAAAHAGIVAFARGASEDVVLDRAQTITERNMPPERYGQVAMDDVDSSEAEYAFDLRHYNANTNTLADVGVPNAIVVTLKRTDAGGNPVPTFLLRLAGLSSWDVTSQSVATLNPTERCEGSGGIFARGQVTLATENHIGSEFCIHSQNKVRLAAQNTFDPDAWVSMPNLEECDGRCTDAANPGINVTGSNMIMPKLNGYIQGTYTAFTDLTRSHAEKIEFFSTRPLDPDLSAVDEMGVNIDELRTGDVINLSAMQFSRMRELPSGLTYNVTCASGETTESTTLELQGIGAGPIMENAALVTNCAIHFGDMANIRGSLIVTTRNQDTPTVTADSGAVIGDPGQTCDAGMRTVIMSMGRLSVPADFVASNVTLVVADDVEITPHLPQIRTLSRGLSIHASGQVDITAKHKLESCGDVSGSLTPDLKVIRHVMPGQS